MRFAGFDGVRGIAILLVIAWHAAISARFPPEALGAWRPLIFGGWAGVDVFFALSGFLITTLILREEKANEEGRGVARFSLAHFYMRRALRIFPIFYTVFAIEAFTLGARHLLPSIQVWTPEFRGSPLGLLPYATFWGNYFANHPPVGAYSPGEAFLVYWSLCVEEHFYLLWPMVLMLVKAPRRRIFLGVAACLLVMVLRAGALRTHVASYTSIQVLSHYRIDSILWGGVAALLWQLAPPRVSLVRGLLAFAAAAVIGLMLTLHLSVSPVGSTLGYSVGLSLLAVAAALLMLELVASPSSLLARALDVLPLRLVGRVSYGMYLVHYPVLDVARRWFFAVPRAPSVASFWMLACLAAGLTFIVAWALHLLVERPFLRLKERWRPPVPSAKNVDTA